ncbi:MAG: hypothetical protein QGD89_04585 [Actinomycetota bacterium]|nr:hypothetical protein [Actinomycetota bacterium]
MTTTLFIGLMIGVGLLAFTFWSVRFIATGPPPEPDLDEVREADIPYICTVCGMSLTITQAHDGGTEPPRHCREDMIRA